MHDAARAIGVIGAGPSGLAAVKNLAARGLPVIGFEREDDVGGNWYYGRRSSSVYDSTHLISSKRMTEYPDFPMPKAFPPYPSHAQALSYLRDYAAHFRLYDHIQFNVTVERAEPCTDGGWLVTLSNRPEPLKLGALIVANGHHWDPLWPRFEGEFAGQILHARDYKSSDVLRDKRVLVVGAGNSGCDIAVEAALHARSATLSLRRGYHFLPKFLLGTPVDSGGEWLRRHGVPWWAVRRLTSWLVHVALGPPERYGLPKPQHALFAAHPIVNSQMLYYVGHGRIQVRPDIESLDGPDVRFQDGRREPFDLIVCATGYRIRFPFLDEGLICDDQGRSRLFLHAFHPTRDDLFVAGMIQPNSGLWSLADWQTRVMAAYLQLERAAPGSAEWFRQLKASPNPDLSHGLPYIDSPRHGIEVEYYSYRKRLQQLLRKLESSLPRLTPVAGKADARTPDAAFESSVVPAWSPSEA